jgi:hypothetical protein
MDRALLMRTRLLHEQHDRIQRVESLTLEPRKRRHVCQRNGLIAGVTHCEDLGVDHRLQLRSAAEAIDVNVAVVPRGRLPSSSIQNCPGICGSSFL